MVLLNLTRWAFKYLQNKALIPYSEFTHYYPHHQEMLEHRFAFQNICLGTGPVESQRNSFHYNVLSTVEAIDETEIYITLGFSTRQGNNQMDVTL